MSADEFARRRRDARRLRQAASSRCARIGHRHLAAADAAHRRIELVEGLLGDPHADLRRERAAAPALVDDHARAACADRVDDRRIVERPQHAQVEDLGLDTLLASSCGGFERLERLPP